MVDWKREIAIAYLVNEKLAEVDVDGIWPFHVPQVAASEESICEVERRFGEPLDPSYRGFLAHADGWKGFAIGIDLFGTRDLLGGPHMERAEEILNALEGLEESYGVARNVL